ncbi:MAG: outer membrane beta-barrel protein [Bacteroidales bacterium]|nr:outer membrane beta-barrel protein [Bacteroidales bacterium]
MKDKRDIGEIIKSSLSEQEEGYIEGSWERFSLKQRRKRFLLFRNISTGVAAAVVLALVVFGVQNDQTSQKIEEVSAIVTTPDTGTEINPSENSDIIKRGGEAGKSQNQIKIVKKAPSEAISGKRLIAKSEITETKEEIVKEPERETEVKKLTALKEQIDSAEIQEPAKRQMPATTPPKPTEESKYQVPATMSSRTAFALIENERHERKVRFGINVAPGMSSATDGSALNIGGGVNLDIAIAKNLDISTGVQVEYRDIETATGNGTGVSAIQQSSYNITNLDIPLNITWKFKNNRTESYYISGGFSSLAYLGENYSTTSYNQLLQSSIVYGTSGEENTVYKLVDVRTTTVERTEPFSSFDVAGRINLMVGYSKSISPKLNLHIEPYLKIPLTGMGSKDVRFTTSGITCKISFR